jgi:hypothetical protein
VGIGDSAAQDCATQARSGEAAGTRHGAANGAFEMAGVIPSSPSQGATILPERATDEATWIRRM